MKKRTLIHGYATANYQYAHIEDGECGVITAYLPEDKIFAVHFEEAGWITFSDMTEVEFNDIFEVEFFDDTKNDS